MDSSAALQSAVPMVRSSALLPFVGFAERIGMPIEKLLSDAKVPGLIHEQPETLIPLNHSFLFVDKLARKLGLEQLGFVVGRDTQFQDLGAFGRLVLQSLTLHEALEKVSRVVHLYSSGQHIWIDTFAGRARLNSVYTPRAGPGWQFGEQYTLTLLINCIRVAAGPNWQPEEIHLGEAMYALMNGRTEVLGGIPVRRAANSALVFDRRLLSSPLRRIQFAHMASESDEYKALIGTAPAADFPDSISQLALMSLVDGHTQIGWIASAAGLSVRTLQRRLAEHGIDYSALIDRVRFDKAQTLLRDADYTFIDIAHELGYTDAATFTRAFRRWTGATPSDFRRLHAPDGRDAQGRPY